MRTNDDDGHPDAGEGDLAWAVRNATAGVDDKDRAVVKLAERYANEIDGAVRCIECGGHRGADLAKLGPALLAALEALQLSPRARKVIGDVTPAAVNPLDELARARAGKGRAPDLDASTS